MAAFESPWLRSMPETSSPASGGNQYDSNRDSSSSSTIAGFSHHHSQQRSTILLHQKSPLLLATPPQVTRALAYSHAFIVPLNKLAALVTWTTGDPWQSFLFVAGFIFAALYGDSAVIYAGPLMVVIFLFMGVHYRTYSPLSSTGWSDDRKKPTTTLEADASSDRKSLDEIVGTLQAFTGRCNILWKPVLQLVDFLSTQQTATTATTKPSLITLFTRILFATPVWFALTLPPLHLITARRVVLVVGTLVLTWHSRSARITRSILWRSRTVRKLAHLVTGLNFEAQTAKPRGKVFPSSNYTILTKSKQKDNKVRFTFTMYENQRRWLGLGWTSNMVAYERGPWTDEHLNNVPPPDDFQLPEVEGGRAKWQWVEGSSWRVETPKGDENGGKAGKKEADEQAAWVYYDNSWLHGSRGVDGWTKYTRRRKWVRDAELIDQVDENSNTATTASTTSTDAQSQLTNGTATVSARHKKTASEAGSESGRSTRSWFSRSKSGAGAKQQQHSRGPSSSGGTTVVDGNNGGGARSSAASTSSWTGDRDREEGRDTGTPVERLKEREADWGLGDDASMELG